MTQVRNRVLCERARAWAALAPDGELAELEHKLLDAHVARCAACSRFAEEVAAVADGLRLAALEPLSRPVAIRAWRRRTAYARMRGAGAAAAVAVMAVGMATHVPLSSGERESFRLPRVVDFSGGDQAELRRLEAAQRSALAGTRPVRTRPTHQTGHQPI